MSVDCGETFSDPGATASDDRYGDLTADIVVGGDVVDNEAPGTYVITYDVMDREGNASAQVTRTVTVTSTDVSLPVIALNGPEIVYLNRNDPYSQPGAVAYDACDPNLPAVTVDNSAVNTGVYGAYVVTQHLTDRSDNATTRDTCTVAVAFSPAGPTRLDWARPEHPCNRNTTVLYSIVHLVAAASR